MKTNVVLVTCPPGEKATELAREAVAQKLAACVNIVPGIRSIYEWEDAIKNEEECLLIFKTLENKRKALEAYVLEHHPYSTPEFIALEAGAVTEKYQKWLAACTSG